MWAGGGPRWAFALLGALVALSALQVARAQPSLPRPQEPPLPQPFVPFSQNVRINSVNFGFNYQVEPTMAINSQGQIFVGWKEAFTHNGGGQRVSFSYSTDGGTTWAPNVLMPLHTYARQSDPWLTVSANDRVFFSRIEYDGTTSPGGIAIMETMDGVTWGPNRLLDDAPRFADKQTHANDPIGGVYMVWNSDLVTSGLYQLFFSRSDDGGATWTPKVRVPDDANGHLGGFVKVHPSGSVLAAWWSWANQNVWFDRSLDGGASWGSDVRVNDLFGSADSPLATDPPVLPAMAVAPNGEIYIVWEDYRNGYPGGAPNGNMDIMFSRSQDGGLTWSPAVRLNDDATTARQWMPDLAIDPSGGIHAAWMDDREGVHHVYYVNSTDGGTTWGANVRVTDAGTPLSYTRPGDYLAIESAPDGTIAVVWTDGRGADLDIYFATLPPPKGWALDTVPPGLTVMLDGIPATAPVRFSCTPGSPHTIATTSPQGSGPTRYAFSSWSDGGAISHGITCGPPRVYTAFFASEHEVTVTTSPPNLNIVVDGMTGVAPQSYWWLDGALHTIGTLSPQTQGATRYSFASWSDGGAQSHMVSISGPGMFTATFDTEFETVLATAPPGLNVTVDGMEFVAPQAFWWAQGSAHTVGTDSPQVVGETRYVFSLWSDGGAQNHTVIASSAGTITADFGSQHAITLNTQPQGFEVRVDGVSFSAPYSFWCDEGAILMIEAPHPLTPGETRVSFMFWSDGGAQAHTILCDGPATYTATFQVEHLIFLRTSPIGLEVTADGSPAFSFWCVQGSPHTIGAPSPQGTELTRYLFQAWSNGGDQEHTILCNGTATYTATFATEHFVTITASPPGLLVAIDGTTTATPVSSWWAEGSVHSVDLASPQGDPQTRYVFTDWSDAGAQAHDILVTAPATVTAAFRTQYRLQVSTSHGSAVCDSPDCWYDARSPASFSVSPTVVPGAPGTRYAFIAWDGDSDAPSASASLTMDAPKVVTARWQTEYLLTLTSAYGTPRGGGWHAEGSEVSVSIEDEVSVGRKAYRFAGWTGDHSGTSATITVTMDGPKQLTAQWEVVPQSLVATPANYALLLAILVVAFLFLVLLFARRRRKGEESEDDTPPK